MNIPYMDPMGASQPVQAGMGSSVFCFVAQILLEDWQVLFSCVVQNGQVPRRY